jgi:hypothetical protein
MKRSPEYSRVITIGTAAASNRRFAGELLCFALLAAILLACGCTTPSRSPDVTTVPTATWIVSTPLATLPPSNDHYAIEPYKITAGGNTGDGVIWNYYHALDTGSYSDAFEFASIPHGQTAREREKARSGFASVYSEMYGLRGEYLTFGDLTVLTKTPVIPCSIHDRFIVDICKNQVLSEAWAYTFTIDEKNTNPRMQYQKVDQNKGYSVSYNGTWYFLERNPVT